MSEKPSSYTRRLAELLGGRRDEVPEAGSWHERILAGIGFDAVEGVKAHLGFTDSEVARLLGIGEATLRRARVSGGALDSATSDRLYRLAKIVAVAEEVLESAANATTWIRRPQPALGGRVPLDLLVTQAGAEQVEGLLRRIDFGVYT